RRASINRPPTPSAEEERDKEASLEEVINIKLVESGEKEKLMELLRERLVECGWRDEMKALCRAYARKKGRNNVTVDDLIHVITPKGRGKSKKKMLLFVVAPLTVLSIHFACETASVPDSVKAELLQRIRSFLMSTSLR
ncbi:Transcription and mRNA export factor SUS1, partial [Dichanthelium oligosanthes]